MCEAAAHADTHNLMFFGHRYGKAHAGHIEEFSSAVGQPAGVIQAVDRLDRVVFSQNRGAGFAHAKVVVVIEQGRVVHPAIRPTTPQKFLRVAQQNTTNGELDGGGVIRRKACPCDSFSLQRNGAGVAVFFIAHFPLRSVSPLLL